MSDKQTSPQRLFGQLLFGKQMTYCLSGLARVGVADHMNAIHQWRLKRSLRRQGHPRPLSIG